MLPTQPFLGFRIAACATGRFLEWLLGEAERREQLLRIGYLNAAMVNLAYQDARQARRLAEMELLYADGQAVVWAAAWLGRPIAERINAGDFTRELMLGVAARGLRLALVGGRPASGELAAECERAAVRFRAWAPELQVVYAHHGYFSEAEADSVARGLREADPHLILMGMGAPRQERWTEAWSPLMGPRAWWCVGALFEYYAGTRRRAPAWMRRLGLEWLVRLALEPRRLAGRYLIGNPLFVYRVLRGKPPRMTAPAAGIDRAK